VRFPRVRFTVRRLMVAVAVVATILWSVHTIHRWRLYRERLRYYILAENLYRPRPSAPERMAASQEAQGLVCYFRVEQAAGRLPVGVCRLRFGLGTEAEIRRFADHLAVLKRKYELAAYYPWLPVAPDPPEPE
jgi:hypothetical protein